MSGKLGMQSTKAWLVPRRYKGKYLDGRLPAARGVKYIRACIESDLGGASNLSRMEYGLIDRAAFLLYRVEEYELALLSGSHPVNMTEYLAVINTLSGLMSKLGLKRRAKQIQLSDYLNAHASQSPPTDSQPQTTTKESTNGNTAEQ